MPKILRRSIALLALIGLLFTASAPLHGQDSRSWAAERASIRAAAPPPVASYRMELRLDPAAKTLTGSGRISYRNPSADRLDELWLRLYLNAFSDYDTLWMRESGGQSRGFPIVLEPPGGLDLQRLAIVGGPDLLPSATLSETLLRVPLPQALLPGRTIELETAWVASIPRGFARVGFGGRDDTFFMLAQFYPKMAVYDQGRWDTEPWHAAGEFFRDFGDYEVDLTLPADYVVAGSGIPSGTQQHGDGTQTVSFAAEYVQDVAFAASPDFLTATFQADDVEVLVYYLPEHRDYLPQYRDGAVGSLRLFSRWYGPYLHQRLSVVDVPNDIEGVGGMEWPTLITGGTLGVPIDGLVELVTAHEVGHQWWPMQTATDEQAFPFLDEGLTEYSGMRYMVEDGRGLAYGPLSLGAASSLDRAPYATSPQISALLPVSGYGGINDLGVAVYNKGAMALWTLENVVGRERFHGAMADYLAAYRFKHPTLADFRSSLEQSLDQDLAWFFDELLGGAGVIDYAAQAIEANSVKVRRVGAVAAPVELRLTFASGRQQTIAWDGVAAEQTFTLPGEPLARLEIDPERKLVAEISRLDNDLSRGVEIETVMGLWRLSTWPRWAVQLLGLFG